MISKLIAVLAKATLSFTISMKDDIVSLTIIPKTKDGEELSNTPLQISGTAEDLDAKFDDIVATLQQGVELVDNSQAFIASIKKNTEEAKSSEKNKADVKVNAGAGSTATKTEKPLALTAKQKTAQKHYEGSLKKAKGEKDPDMVEFLKKQIVKEYTDTGFPQDQIDDVTKEFEDIIASLVAGGTGNSDAAPEKIEEGNNGTDGGEEGENNEEKEEEEEDNGAADGVVTPAAADDDDDIF